MSVKSAVRRKNKGKFLKRTKPVRNKKAILKKKTRSRAALHLHRGGFDKGFDHGYDKGYTDGFSKGFEEGFEHLYSAS